MSASVFAPAVVPSLAALHALTAGTMGTMTLAVMTRATLGHTGRKLTADAWTTSIYGLVVGGALLRVAASIFFIQFYMPTLVLSAALWSGAFMLFALRYGPMLLRPRQ